jgi:hypothetical protein
MFSIFHLSLVTNICPRKRHYFSMGGSCQLSTKSRNLRLLMKDVRTLSFMCSSICQTQFDHFDPIPSQCSSKEPVPWLRPSPYLAVSELRWDPNHVSRKHQKTMDSCGFHPDLLWKFPLSHDQPLYKPLSTGFAVQQVPGFHGSSVVVTFRFWQETTHHSRTQRLKPNSYFCWKSW